MEATAESTTNVLPCQCNYPESKNEESNKTISLPQKVILSVKQFISFIGYPRSGHSIVGSLLDAHPNVAVANEFHAFQWLTQHSTLPQEKIRDTLFNLLYQNTYNNVFRNGTRSNNGKGYNLTVENGWQERYRQHIDVIGEKNGGAMTQLYHNDITRFNAAYKMLTQFLPVKFIHCVRNPFDIISTIVLYKIRRIKHQKDFISSLRQANTQKQYKNDEELNKAIDFFFISADSVVNISQYLDSDVLEIHNHELVSHPADTMVNLCQYLNIHCPRDYVQSCAHKVFPEISRTRYFIDWPEETKAMVQRRIKQYSFFDRYSYDSSI